MTNSVDSCLCLSGWGTARADVASIAALRKSLPAWVPPDTPGHFLKHADEQTVLAVAAVDNAISSLKAGAADYQDWAIIAAPRFIGRIAGATTFARYVRGGGPAISPHLIPQHSLHSVSGALSILLGSRQPNFGIGGTGRSLIEGLLAALTFPPAGSKGTWLIATSWDPEPQMDATGNFQNEPVCHAVALALQSGAQHGTCGNLRLVTDRCRLPWVHEFPSIDDAAGLFHALFAAVPSGVTRRFTWPLSSSAAMVLEVHAPAAALPLAA